MELDSLFEDRETSHDYATIRHYYSDEFFKFLVDYCKETIPELNLVVDVGCGPGNSTIGFAKYFKQVIGVDVSETQIALAPRYIPNCKFIVGYGHELTFLPDQSVDLFSAGLSFNLMPQKETLAEADRVLRPGGTIAIFGYGPPRCTDSLMDQVIQKTYGLAMKSLPPMLLSALTRYENMDIPYPGLERRDGPVITNRMARDGVPRLWRLFQRTLSEFGDKSDTDGTYLRECYKILNELVPETNEDRAKIPRDFELKFHPVVILGRKSLDA